jgi:hypothetical protein
MADVTPRISYANLVTPGSVLIVASAAQSTHPAARLRHALRSDVWRTPVGWTVVEDENDSLDFTEQTTGDATATLTPGTYATGAELAAEIQTQLNAEATDNTYTCTYSSTTKKFTIARATGSASFGLEWATGANAATSCGKDLGFTVSADDTGATSYVADLASYQSRAWVTFDLGAAAAVRVGVVLNHNAGASGTFKLLANASDAWTSPSVTQTLAGDADIRIAWFSTQTYRYWRLLVEDVQNTDGFTEVGVAWIGDYLQLAYPYQDGFKDGYEGGSEVSFGDHGAHYRDPKPGREIIKAAFAHHPDSDRLALKTFRSTVDRGGCFIIARDPQNETTEALYAYIEDLEFEHSPADGLSWSFDIEFREALG